MAAYGNALCKWALTVKNIHLAAMVGSSSLMVHSPDMLQTLSIAGSQAEKLPAGLISPLCTMQENQPSAVSSNIDTAVGIRLEYESRTFLLLSFFEIHLTELIGKDYYIWFA